MALRSLLLWFLLLLLLALLSFLTLLALPALLALLSLLTLLAGFFLNLHLLLDDVCGEDLEFMVIFTNQFDHVLFSEMPDDNSGEGTIIS